MVKSLKNSDWKCMIAYSIFCICMFQLPVDIAYPVIRTNVSCDNDAWCKSDSFDMGITSFFCNPDDPKINFKTVALISHIFTFGISPLIAFTSALYPLYSDSTKDKKMCALTDSLIIILTLLISLGWNSLAKVGAQRQRPCFYYNLENLTEVYDLPSEEFVSFYSGDATIAFSTFGTGILLAIARNRPYIKLYRNWGGLVAFTGSFLRIVAFMHWTTDVLTGIITGFFFGFGVPCLIFLKGEDDEDEDDEFKSQEINNPFNKY